jgi:hypothetical protein
MKPPHAFIHAKGGEHHIAIHDRNAHFAVSGIGCGIGYQHIAIMNAARPKRLSHDTHRIDIRAAQIEPASQIDDRLYIVLRRALKARGVVAAIVIHVENITGTIDTASAQVPSCWEACSAHMKTTEPVTTKEAVYHYVFANRGAI